MQAKCTEKEIGRDSWGKVVTVNVIFSLGITLAQYRETKMESIAFVIWDIILIYWFRISIFYASRGLYKVLLLFFSWVLKIVLLWNTSLKSFSPLVNFLRCQNCQNCQNFLLINFHFPLKIVALNNILPSYHLTYFAISFQYFHFYEI